MRRALFAVLALAIALPAVAQETITPDQLWSALVTGNKQYQGGKIVYDNLKAEREQFKNAQAPPITVLACSDSRVPPELAFNQSLGGLLVVRTMGNVADEAGLASIEFGLSRGWTKLIVVLAHEKCGAVEASLGGADPASPPLSALAKRIRSSFVNIPYDALDQANVRKATEANARAAAAQLLAGSTMIRDAVLTNRVKVVPAYYELVSGEVKKIE
ncbi:MAG TPA: carbonic anhydrase [Thermoanaerobaculia bacterium]